MVTVGLTGGIGSGKSLISDIFNLLDIPGYDSDTRARDLMHNSNDVRAQLAELFGREIYVDGQLDRASIAAAVFADDQLLSQLNTIIHPVVGRDFENWVEIVAPQVPYVIKESAIIFETAINQSLDQVILVTAPVEVRLKRVMARDSVDEQAVRARMAKQWTDGQKIPLADYVIVNDGDKSLIRQVLEIHNHLVHAL